MPCIFSDCMGKCVMGTIPLECKDKVLLSICSAIEREELTWQDGMDKLKGILMEKNDLMSIAL